MFRPLRLPPLASRVSLSVSFALCCCYHCSFSPQLNPFPDFADATAEATQVERVLTAARKAGTVDTVVLSTSTLAETHLDWLADGANYPKPLQTLGKSKYLAEEALRSDKGQWLKHTTILRPPWLTYNFTSPSGRLHFPEWWTEGVLKTSILPDVPLAQLDAGDVGRVAAKVLLAPEAYAGLELKLAVASLSLQEVFHAIGEITGTELKAEWVDPKTLLAEPAKGKAVDIFGRLRGGIGWSCNVKSSVLAEEEFEKQKVFGVELTPVKQSLENLRSELLVHFRGGVA